MLDGVPALQDPAKWGVVTREADENMRVRTQKLVLSTVCCASPTGCIWESWHSFLEEVGPCLSLEEQVGQGRRMREGEN